MIAIIDYDAGNLKSVKKALEFLGEEAVITRDEDILRMADKLILPGVGNFGDCMDKLNSYNLTSIIRELAKAGKPILGICLGLQLFFEESEEAPGVKGLSLLEGKIVRIPKKEDITIPQIGWNSLNFKKESRLFKGIDEGSYVYFVHSYYLQPKDMSIVSATTQYSEELSIAVECDNIYATQFHPEKSGDIGLKILKNFATL